MCNSVIVEVAIVLLKIESVHEVFFLVDYSFTRIVQDVFLVFTAYYLFFTNNIKQGK